MNRIGFKSLLDSVVSVNVWIDVVPEGRRLPAASFVHISNGSDRILSGRSSGHWDTWRVSITGKTRGQCDEQLEKLKMLDNTSNIDFLMTFVVSVGDIESRSDSKVTMAYVDFKTYDR